MAEYQDWSAVVSEWTVIVPFHNERRFLRATLASLAAQTVRPLVILVDNASTDQSAEVARAACEEFGMAALHIAEHRPGKVAALQRGLAETRSRFVATCDADTLYPADYLELAGRLLGRRGTVAAVAAYCAADAPARSAWLAGWRMALTSRLLPQQCLNGGAGQVFLTAALKQCGGFDPAIWNWVLEDHEIMARIETLGTIAYHPDFLCHPTPRPRSVNCTGWNLLEQLRYHATRGGERVRYFHEYLAPRLRDRALPSERLRRVELVPGSA